MTEKIYNLFNEIATKHKYIQSFKFGSLSKLGGTGYEKLPELFLETPINISTNKVEVNFDITTNQFNVKDKLPAVLIAFTEQIALDVISYIKNYISSATERIWALELIDYNILSLDNWYDNNNYGVRVSLSLKVKDELNYCTPYDSIWDNSVEVEPIEKRYLDYQKETTIYKGDVRFKE